MSGGKKAVDPLHRWKAWLNAYKPQWISRSQLIARLRSCDSGLISDVLPIIASYCIDSLLISGVGSDIYLMASDALSPALPRASPAELAAAAVASVPKGWYTAAYNLNRAMGRWSTALTNDEFDPSQQLVPFLTLCDHAKPIAALSVLEPPTGDVAAWEQLDSSGKPSSYPVIASGSMDRTMKLWQFADPRLPVESGDQQTFWNSSGGGKVDAPPILRSQEAVLATERAHTSWVTSMCAGPITVTAAAAEAASSSPTKSAPGTQAPKQAPKQAPAHHRLELFTGSADHSIIAWALPGTAKVRELVPIDTWTSSSVRP